MNEYVNKFLSSQYQILKDIFFNLKQVILSYYLSKKNINQLKKWANKLSQLFFFGKKNQMKSTKYFTMKYCLNHHCTGLWRKRDNFKKYISDYLINHVLLIWHLLFNEISSDILCMNSIVPNFVCNNTSQRSNQQLTLFIG